MTESSFFGLNPGLLEALRVDPNLEVGLECAKCLVVGRAMSFLLIFTKGLGNISILCHQKRKIKPEAIHGFKTIGTHLSNKVFSFAKLVFSC
jgi:hypothetical protein